ncbi:MAG: diacylglycerol kinase family lipid kinase [Bacteroidales bacterium]|nr:diacylglycerol kinase family lipid kinase [Bacteroidales bacterium]
MKKSQEESWIFIVNPIAGNGYAGSLVPKLEEMIDRHGLNAQVIFSERSGHATELAAHYADQGVKFIIGVGGDGTLNEIASANLQRKDLVLGLIPAGTGNDFIQILGFPDRFEDKHWEIFFEKHLAAMDAGICNGLPFFNGMGLGFDAQVAAENYVEPGEVKRGGKNKYLYHIIKTILLYKERMMSVVSEGKMQSTNCFINTVSIGRRFAGGFFLTPKAIANDGLLDVCMIKKLSVPERFGILLKVPKGTHIQNKKVHYYQTPGLKIEFEHEVPFHLDGELHFARNFDISILPGAVNIIFNPEGNHFFNLS